MGDSPALVSVAVERQELFMPPKIEAKQATGFAVYTMRTVLAGNGPELIDLASKRAPAALSPAFAWTDEVLQRTTWNSGQGTAGMSPLGAGNRPAARSRAQRAANEAISTK